MELPRAGAYLFAGLALEPAAELLVRPIVAADRETGAIQVGDRIREGQGFSFCLREAIGARDEVKAMASGLEARLAGKRPAFGIYVDCMGRGSALYGAAGVDRGQLLKRFPDLPLVGFQSAFELGPVGGRTRPHLQTGALLLCAEP